MQDIATLLAEHRFFRDMPEETRTLLAGCGRNVVFAPGTIVLREGQRADHFWAIRSGQVVVGTTTPGAGLVPLETLDDGDIVGWSWLFPPHLWHFDAVAQREVRAVEFDAVCLLAKCHDDPAMGFDLSRRFAAIIYARLRASRLQVLDLYANPKAR